MVLALNIVKIYIFFNYLKNNSLILYLDLCKESISCPNIIYVISKLNFDITKLNSKLLDLAIKISFWMSQFVILAYIKNDIYCGTQVWYLNFLDICLTLVSTYIIGHLIISCCFHVQIVKKMNFTSMNIMLVVLYSTPATLSCVVVQPHS
jgi:hypothetical protein